MGGFGSYALRRSSALEHPYHYGLDDRRLGSVCVYCQSDIDFFFQAMTAQAPFADPLWHNRASSAYYGESHRKLQKEVRAYVDHHIAPFCADWEQQGSVPTEVEFPGSIRRSVRTGWLSSFSR